MNLELEETIMSMKDMAKLLVPNTFPLVSFDEELAVLCLKQRNIRIDGYEVCLCFSRAQYDGYYLDSLQMQSCQSPFMPFNLVCNIGQSFLGKENLFYVDFFKNNKKVYCWAVKTANGNILPPGENATATSYEGFEYHVLSPGTINILPAS